MAATPSCLELRYGKDIVIIDAGLRYPRCAELILAKQGPRPIHLFVGHTHWDHIQGFPFFAPAYITRLRAQHLRRQGLRQRTIRSVFQGQLDSA